ncbi:hypothetical protein P4H27_09980 [Paenibacillus taichungensis]|uniref:hypothetical protein n=1 Tax=Paenibacillus taichungensis TaxID=484184 RepID=UPI002DBEC102|nr:hypothetical protein [Paenibacillus taichungensis]MEC0107264.1 hypothetical protein [Paenibacillus taichungensis]MEC0194804.1 hypothetical protein [Paenibacillus taichungensis]
MAAKKGAQAEKLVTVKAAVPVVIWRANRPLTDDQHAELSRKLKSEQQGVGVELLLVPYSTDVEIAIDQTEETTDPKPATEPKNEPDKTEDKTEDKTNETTAAPDTSKDTTAAGE